jgi:hypothetical protein
MSKAAPDRGEFPKPTSFAGKSFAGGLIKFRDKSAASVPVNTAPSRAPVARIPREQPVSTTAPAPPTTAPARVEPSVTTVPRPPRTTPPIPDITMPEVPRQR